MLRIAAAQIRSAPGDIAANISKHCRAIQLAADQQVGLLSFPELSLTNYEPNFAKALALHFDDPRLEVFQELSNSRKITISVGLPISTNLGIQIGSLWFQPNQPRQCYSKQRLHVDETQTFVSGDRQLLFHFDRLPVAPAICFESLQPEHAQMAAQLGARVYLASVAKSSVGITKANTHYPCIARQYGMTVIMANGIGPSDNFVQAGSSGIWNSEGCCVLQLNQNDESLLWYDFDQDLADSIPIA